MTSIQGFEYIVITLIPTGKIAEFLTVEINRVAKYGWRLVGTPAQGTTTNMNVWTAAFERPKEWATEA